MANIAMALELLTTLISQAMTITTQIKQAQASGQDLTPAQVAALVAAFNTDFSKLQNDISIAHAAGK